MRKFCPMCGKPLTYGQRCSCNARISKTNTISISSSINNLQDSFLSLQTTINSFIESPIYTICTNARDKNWITATLLILIALISQSVATLVTYVKYDNNLSSAIFFKILFVKAILICFFGFSIFWLIRLLNRTEIDFIETYSAIGIALIPVIIGALLSCILSLIYNELSYIVMNYAKIFTILTITLAIKKIHQIRREKILILIVSLSVLLYNFANFIINKIF